MQTKQIPTTSRRCLLGQAAVGAAGAVGAASLVADALAAEDPHVAWRVRADALRARINVGDLDDAAMRVLGDELDGLHDLIAEVPARTLAGAIAQLDVARQYLEGAGRTPVELCQEECLRNAIATLEKLA